MLSDPAPSQTTNCHACGKTFYTVAGHSCGDTAAIEQTRLALYKATWKGNWKTDLSRPHVAVYCPKCKYHYDARMGNPCTRCL
jgi:hypothetical protein